MAQVEDDIIAEGVQIIWVLEQTQSLQPGTAERCLTFVNGEGSEKGLCAGDNQTQPEPGTFDDSPFSSDRGFDMLVRRENMEIVFTAAHGTPAGNENLTGQELLAAIQMQKLIDEGTQ